MLHFEDYTIQKFSKRCKVETTRVTLVAALANAETDVMARPEAGLSRTATLPRKAQHPAAPGLRRSLGTSGSPPGLAHALTEGHTHSGTAQPPPTTREVAWGGRAGTQPQAQCQSPSRSYTEEPVRCGVPRACFLGQFIQQRVWKIPSHAALTTDKNPPQV